MGEFIKITCDDCTAYCDARHLPATTCQNDCVRARVTTGDAATSELEWLKQKVLGPQDRTHMRQHLD